MNHYAYFRGYICTANPDGSIPLNSRIVSDLRGAQGIKESGGNDSAGLLLLIGQANAATDLLRALESLVERCDGAEGVRADGSNIDTRAAHALLDRITGK